MSFHDQQDRKILTLHTTKGERVQVHLDDPRQLERLRPGSNIVVRGRWAAAGALGGSGGRRRRFVASSLAALSTSGGDGAAVAATSAAAGTAALDATPPAPANLNTIFIPIAGVNASGGACMPNPDAIPFTRSAIEKVVFEEDSPGKATVGSTYNRCSYGKTKLTRQNSLVADVVKLPCSGVTDGTAWSFSTCDFLDFDGWASAANQVLRNRGVAVDSFFYKVYMVPPGACGWIGLGYIGCNGGFECRAWVNGNMAFVPQALAHELGHNLFMGHSGANGNEYDDHTCVQGACCYDRCWNTPHAWQQGWLTPTELDGASLAPGQTITTTMASQSLSDKTGLRIVPSWAPSHPPIFVGYRTANGPDAGLPEGMAGKVHVYTSNISNSRDPAATSLEASLSGGAAWSSNATAGVVVRLTSTNGTHARVSVCRKGGPETNASCTAGKDMDCNGLAGPEDPACTKYLPPSVITPQTSAPAPPPRPKPRPPPPRPKPRPPPPRPKPRPPPPRPKPRPPPPRPRPRPPPSPPRPKPRPPPPRPRPRPPPPRPRPRPPPPRRLK